MRLGIKNTKRILIIPMSAMAETSGPSTRCRLLAEGFKNAGLNVAACMAEDVNFKSIDGVKNYFLEVPMPFGLPAPIASRTFPMAQKLGITSGKQVDSFDQVLFMTGNLDYKYLKKSISSVSKAIREFKPDIVYSEFNISAMIAARAENVTLYSTVSYPTQHEYAHSSRFAKGLNKALKEMGLPQVDSALQLFDWADKKFCPSIRTFEPIDKKDTYYLGAMRGTASEGMDYSSRNKILVYMGNGTISASKMLRVISNAFKDSKYDIYIASSYLEEGDFSNIHVAPRFDFNILLDEALLFINHGGQNSVVDGLLHGVPQIIIPGKVFERKFNAACISNNHAGVTVKPEHFNANNVREIAEKIISDKKMRNSARYLGVEFAGAGGIQTILKEIP